MRFRLLAVCLAAWGAAAAQDDARPGVSLEQAPRLMEPVAVQRGLNAAVTMAGVHDSSVGWYNVVTPVLSYTFSPHFSADASMSIYPYRMTRSSTGQLTFTGGDVGDVLLEGHASFNPGRFRTTATAAMTVPTGNRTDGLGTGRVTFNLDDHVERYFGQTGLLVDVGGGDSSGLTNRLVTEDDDSLGPLAQFQVGMVHWFPHSISFQSVAYEQLPIGDQKTYTTLTRQGFPSATFPTGRRVYEDNGFTNTLNLPLTSHVILTGAYNRSLRLHLDTASVGVTLVWKGFPVRRGESLIDKAMREAERENAMIPRPVVQ